MQNVRKRVKTRESVKKRKYVFKRFRPSLPKCGAGRARNETRASMVFQLACAGVGFRESPHRRRTQATPARASSPTQNHIDPKDRAQPKKAPARAPNDVRPKTGANTLKSGPNFKI